MANLHFVVVFWLLMTRPHILTNLSHHSNKLKDQEMLWAASCFVILAGFLMDCVSAHVGKQCREERSINGMALQGFVFKKLFVRAFHECDISCERDITCQSCNFVVGEKSCELNNRTKEARPEHFRSDPARFYMSRLKERAPLGSIPELPAHSCHEIKASEGKDTSSSKYWLDPTANGTAVLVYCDMNLEDVDECITDNHDCDVNANCTNTVSGHNCSCKEGFTGDGRSCSDIDECKEGSHDCGVNAICINTVGGHNCSCKEGFAGDGRSCLGKMSFRVKIQVIVII
ncbi:von Willebrand factor C and EGF domain-containing protein-like [Orbicella faveolata]|uniref:von Willebrand factor C and EGF domain-containing protein-like n=1 Tax=Orbicella faveolata TaxID=48498 RepID=UPI0009E49CDC|nr:von Willebrand factor C and EGF domain-containing protein-like [Orbicella faveolata]